MEKITTGRRVASFSELERPGDYYGPTTELGHREPRVFFKAPVELWPGSRSIASVAFPPHRYRECDDGSLEIRESILLYGRTNEEQVWHGYLDEGHVWREV